MSAENPDRSLNAVALDPANTVVIEACAGSGKTWLLVSRIVRLLLAGVKPSEILAITFTRKAAQEMQARLHQWLRLLATADDDEVRQFLREREVEQAQLDEALVRARALFEDFLIDQPGITINTFHGWFLQLLKRAPLAAGAASGASLAERTSTLIDEAWEVFAESLQHNADSPVAIALNWLFENYGLMSTRNLLTNFLSKRAEWWTFTRGQPDPVAASLQVIRSEMPVAPDEDVIGALFADDTFNDELAQYSDLLKRNATATDVRLAETLRAGVTMAVGERRFEQVWSAVFTSAGTLRARKAGKAMEKRLGAEGQERLLSLHAGIGERLAGIRAMRTEQQIYQLNEAGLLCGRELLDRYQMIKRERGLIDYTDVEWRTWSLLATSDYAEYMQYRLDARYKHILLDEFQDTNPLQWQILKTWLEAAAQVQSQPRVFVVGDPKQSIYRFRRAEPRLFDIVRRYLQENHGAQVCEQHLTRRNAPAVVRAVNSLFADAISGFVEHVAHRETLPGKVEVLPLPDRQASEAGLLKQAELPGNTPQWRNPLDSPAQNLADRRRELEANELAKRIGDMVGRWHVIDADKTRPLRFEDIYILVRRRTHLDVYERALRDAQVPFLSSRQGGLLDTLEAADLTALLKFLVIPFADIHLASALRSPMFSVSDEDLMKIAAADGRHWWQRLSHLVEFGVASSALRRAHGVIGNWMHLVDLLPVHDLLDRIFFEADLVNRYEAAVPPAMRAGVVANLRAFLEVALSTDSGRYPSLQGFLHELESLRRASGEEAPDVGIIAEGLNAVRILTVHGAKGLEAPVVWLVDTNSGAGRTDSYDVLVDWPPEVDAPTHFSLFSRKDERGESRARLFEQDAALAAREDLNLLYVAMTRAQQALIVSTGEAVDRDESWYARIARAVDASATHADFPLLDDGDIIEVASAHASPMAASEALSDDDGLDALRKPLNVGRRSDNVPDQRRRQGTLVHALLEHCVPPDKIMDRSFLRQTLGVSEAEFDILWKTAHSIIDEPALARFFDPQHYRRAFNELSYVSADGELRRIDRVVEFDDEIWILDYKTGDAVLSGDLAGAARPYLQQLEGYRVALAQLLPGKRVRTALVFSGGLLHETSSPGN
ncbi:MAG: UvrD-helicase domain-containing protein [Burkholderiales bacterium]|jgi:ATP-dependent helicase/nuclease subunit A